MVFVRNTHKVDLTLNEYTKQLDIFNIRFFNGSPPASPTFCYSTRCPCRFVNVMPPSHAAKTDVYQNKMEYIIKRNDVSWRNLCDRESDINGHIKCKCCRRTIHVSDRAIQASFQPPVETDCHVGSHLDSFPIQSRPDTTGI